MPIALAGLDGEVIAIALLFALLAGVLIVRPLLVAVLSQAPFIGGWLGANVDAGLAAFERAMQAPARAALGVLSASIDWLSATASGLASGALGGFLAVYQGIWKLTHLELPALEQRAAGFAAAAVAEEHRLEAGALAAVAAGAAGALEAARAADAAALAAARGDLGALVAGAETLAKDLFAVAEQDAAGLAQAERAFVLTEVLGVEAEIHQAFAQATAAAAAGEAALRGDLAGVEAQLRGAIQGEVDSLLKQIAADKEALSKALAGGLAGVLVDIAAIRALKCIQRCAELGALGDVLQVMSLAEIFALIEAILHDPQGFEHDWLPPIQALVSGTVQQVRAGLGV